MPLLHEPHKTVDDFELTPDYNHVLHDWVIAHPDQPRGPRFTADECAAFRFRWPADPPATVAPARAANGQFVKQG
jgi:hypothetical protein